MDALILLAAGAIGLAALQGVGLALWWLADQDWREARSYWYTLTGWPIWVWFHLILAHRLRKAEKAQPERVPAPELGEKWRTILDEQEGR